MHALLYILLDVAPESWLLSLASNVSVAAILGFFNWYFIGERKKDSVKYDEAIKALTTAHATTIKELTDRYESLIEKLRVEQNAERQLYRERIDGLIEKISDITKQAITSNNQSSVVLNELKEAINELRGKK